MAPLRGPVRSATAAASASRSIDEYYNAAYEQGATNGRFQYYLLFLALGIANSG